MITLLYNSRHLYIYIPVTTRRSRTNRIEILCTTSRESTETEAGASKHGTHFQAKFWYRSLHGHGAIISYVSKLFIRCHVKSIEQLHEYLVSIFIRRFLQHSQL
jgi:hypothetical protein